MGEMGFVLIVRLIIRFPDMRLDKKHLNQKMLIGEWGNGKRFNRHNLR